MIQIQPVNSTNATIKSAIEKIAREAQKLTNVGGSEGKVYVDTAPSTADLDEGAFVLYYDLTNYRIYTKLNGVVKFWALT